ncbi:hypothetical protein ACWEQ4_01380 [Rhodococcus sp. NPDC003994]
MTHTDASGRELWSAQECADFLAVKLRTWHAYVNRPGKNNPAPQPVEKIFGRIPVWDPADVKHYAENRSRAINT